VKQGTGISASLAAIFSSLATIACCLPLGFGFWQQQRTRQCAVRGRVVGTVMLWAAVAVVLGMILFPQQIAGFIADRFYETGK
jgi:hypothetical protein